MQKPSEASVTTAVRSLDSKVVVITPKQLAELGIDKDIKRVYQRVRKGDGAFTTKQPVSGGLLNTLRARINVLLTEQSVVTDTKPEVCENRKPAESEVKSPRKKDIVILSDKVVHYSESEMQAMLKPTQQHVINGTLDAERTIRGTEPQPKSKNPNFVPDRTPENPAAEEVSSCDTKPPAEPTRPTSAKQSTVPCGQLIRSTFAKRFDFVKTYSKVNVISIVHKDEPQQTPTPQSSKKPLARIIKPPSSTKMDDAKPKEVKAKPDAKTKEPSKPKEEPKPQTKEPEGKEEPQAIEEPKSKAEPKPKAKQDPKAKDEDPTTKDKEDPKTKDEEEPATPVVPKKRGRPRKTPLQPKVDEDSEPEPPRPEKPRREVKETPKVDQTNPTPKRRGRPRKVAAEPKPEEASSDEDSPVEKKRRPTKKAEPKVKEVSTPSTGTRTSGRKRKVVDYAALSGGRISSSEEEDFAEILAEEERNKKKTKKDKEEDIVDDVEEAEEEKKEDAKVVKTPKIEAVHPLKKRLKMEHAQAIEKEKLEESKAEKDKNGEGDAMTEKEDGKMDTTEKIEEKESKKAEPAKPSENSEEPKKLVSENSTNKVNDKAPEEVPESKTNKTSEKEKPTEPIPEKTKATEEEKKVTATEEVKTTTASEEEKLIKASEEENTTKATEEEKLTKGTEEEKTTKATEEEKTTKATEGENLTKATEKEKMTEAGLEEDAPVKEEEATSREIKCGVCDETVDSEASWTKHKLAQHNDLAWKVGEKPLTLEDTNLVFKILTNVLRQYGTLSCLACGEDFATVKKYSRHSRKCGEAGYDASVTPSYSTEPKKRGRKRKPNSILDVLQAMVPTLAKPTTSDSGELCDEKKWKPVVFGNDVVCAICKEEMPKKQWAMHKLNKHNNLTWREGEQPLDLSDHRFVQRVLSDLYYRKIPLRCETCGEKKKSVVGFLSHKTQCQKTNEEIEGLKVTCQLCGRSMLPVSMTTHMALSHSAKSDKKNEEENEVLAPRKAASKAAGIIESLSKGDTEKKFSKSIIKNVDLSCEEAVNKLQKDIDGDTDCSCVFMMCKFRSDRLDYLMEHIMNKCPKRMDTTYTCNYCLKTDRIKQSIVEHVRVEHKDKTEDDFIIKQAFEDHDFKETAVDPMDFLDDRVDCTVMTGTLGARSSTSYPPKIKHKAGFLRFVAAKKNLWELFGEAYVWTMEFVQQNYIYDNIFPDVILKKDVILQIDPSRILNYLPKLKRSIDVVRMVSSTVSNPIGLEHNWKNFRLFESEIHDDGTSTIFCGGPVNALAWAPTPYEASDPDQILAVSVLPDPDAQFRISDRHLNKSLIQFWNFGNLKNGMVSQFQPKLAFCIAHSFGVIWNLEWCPSGCYDFCTPEDSVAKRLGLLAVATGDSAVYVYVVPQPDEIDGKILETKPKYKLTLSSKLPMDFGEMAYHPISLSWSKAQFHSYIAVGYSNGFIGIYNLRNQHHQSEDKDGVIVIYPYQSFHAHDHAVTALSLNHLSGGNRWLVSGSADKDVQFWDLEDEDLIYNNKRYPVSDLTWNIHWLSPIVCHDYLNLYASVQCPVRDCNGPGSNFLPTASRITSVTSNDWGNLFMQASDCGEVMAGMPEQMHERFHNDKRRHIRRSRFLASYTSFIKKDLSEDEMRAIERNRLKQTQGKITPDNVILLGPISYDDCKNYGLVINDLDSTIIRPKEIPSVELDKYLAKDEFFKMHKPDLYPMQSIDKMALNPNLQSFLYYALGYHVGFVRVSIIRFLNSKNV